MLNKVGRKWGDLQNVELRGDSVSDGVIQQ